MIKKAQHYNGRGFLWTAAVLLTLFLALNFAQARPKKESEVTNLGSASGAVTGAKPFTAAKVYFKNVDRRILYMVYTSGGKFQVMHLLPGNYEVTVQTKGQESNVQKIEVKGPEKLAVNATLHEVSDEAAANGVQLLAYDDIYPPGSAGRKTAERLCIRCHGPSFLPSRQWDADQWNSAIDFMKGSGNPRALRFSQVTWAMPTAKYW